MNMKINSRESWRVSVSCRANTGSGYQARFKWINTEFQRNPSLRRVEGQLEEVRGRKFLGRGGVVGGF